LFDGALPDTKRNERLSRLGSNNQRVRQFRASYPVTACPIPTHLGSVLYSLLAPALREALSESKYASVTRIVPGEADDYCAPSANEYPRSILFSNDTDLVLYNYPAEARVIFLRDVELWPEPKFKGYSPTKLSQALHLNSLVPFAYCISQDPWISSEALMKDAKRVDTRSSQYKEFSKRYNATCVAPHICIESGTELALQTLDVRVSEFVHQALGSSLVPTVYLPLMVEDPNQASAWNTGHGVRSLAYSLLAEHRVVIHEYMRKAQAIALREIKALSLNDILLSAAALSRDVGAWLQWTNDRQVSQDFIWPLIAVNVVLQEVPVPPNITCLMRVLSGQFDNTWAFVHLTARMQAALYSLRLFKQCSAVWLSMHRDGSEELHKYIGNLHRTLHKMPTIADLFRVPGQRIQPHGDLTMLRDLIEEIYTVNNVEIPDEPISNKRLKKQKREAERKQRKRQEASNQRTDNLFELLNRKQ
jgi:hypothetical protein